MWHAPDSVVARERYGTIEKLRNKLVLQKQQVRFVNNPRETTLEPLFPKLSAIPAGHVGLYLIILIASPLKQEQIEPLPLTFLPA